MKSQDIWFNLTWHLQAVRKINCVLDTFLIIRCVKHEEHGGPLVLP